MTDFKDYQAMPVPIEVTQKVDAVIVTSMTQKLDDDRIIEQWSGRLHEMLDQMNVPYMVVDFQNVQFATSRVLGCLLSLKYTAQEKKIALGLSGLNDFIMEAFTMTCLDRVFVIGKNIDKTLELLKEHGSDVS